MSEPLDPNPTGRFSRLADLYARCRPDYPAAAIDLILQRCGLSETTLLVDIGCGTGISSRQVAARGVPVLGIEPNEAMRLQAEAAGGPANLSYRAGTAEATGLGVGSVWTVLAAQAFHWFDAGKALAEFSRILRPGGWVALMWNERDESDAGTAAYGAVIRTAPDAGRIEGPRVRAGQVLLESPLFTEGERIHQSHVQELDEEGLLGRAFSASYAPREEPAATVFARGLCEVFSRHQREGRIRLCYVTTVYLARKPAEPAASARAQDGPVQ